MDCLYLLLSPYILTDSVSVIVVILKMTLGTMISLKVLISLIALGVRSLVSLLHTIAYWGLWNLT